MTHRFDSATVLCSSTSPRLRKKSLPPPSPTSIWLTEPRYAEYAPQVAEHIRRRQMEGARRRLLDHHPVRHRRPARQDVPHRLQRDQRPHDRRECPGTGRLCAEAAKLSSRKPKLSPAPSPTTRGTTRGISPSCAPRSWSPTASRSIFSTTIAARRSCRSWCATSSAPAASWSPPATIRPATTR